jgi:helix-turn-helix protein
MTIPSELMELWQQYSSAAFPKGYGSKEINRVDLSLLDAEISGCVRLYILNDGKIDRQQVKMLRDRLIDLNTIILLMDREELTYFDRLRKMANLVLQEVDKNIG